MDRLKRGCESSIIRHDHQYKEGQAFASLSRRVEDCPLFPVKLAAPFLEDALYATTISSLKVMFLQYVSVQEREVFLKVSENVNSVDTDA